MKGAPLDIDVAFWSRATGRRRGGWRICVLLAAVVVPGGLAHGQTAPGDSTGFSAERWATPIGASGFLGVEDGDVLPAPGYAVALAMSYAARPVALRDPATHAITSVPVDRLLTGDLAVAFGLGKRYQLGVALALIPYQSGDRLRGAGQAGQTGQTGQDDQALATTALGDARLGAKLRLAGRPGASGRALAASLALVLPTGDAGHFSGERGVLVSGQIIASWRGPWLSLAASLGTRLRTEEVALGSQNTTLGNELAWALAASVALPGLARHGVSLAGEYVHVRGDEVVRGQIRGPSPAELRAGLSLALPAGMTVVAGGGAGITAEIGAPSWRAFLVVRYERRDAPAFLPSGASGRRRAAPPAGPAVDESASDDAPGNDTTPGDVLLPDDPDAL